MTETTIGIYLDTNVLIYAVQAEDGLASPLIRLLADLARANHKPVTSELTLAELLCKRDLSQELQDTYLDLLVASDTIRLEPVSREILLSSAEMRRLGGALKLQDAIHVATALRAGCKYMLTNDDGIRISQEGLTFLRPTVENIAFVSDALHV